MAFEFAAKLNITQWVRGAKDMAQAVEDVTDTIKDLASEGSHNVDKAANALGTDIPDGAADAEKAVKSLDERIKDTMDDTAQRAKSAGGDLGSGIKRGAADADEGVKALKENTASNAKEMGASFQDVGSAVSSLQGLTSEALEGFGPAGLAAGVAMAAGIGLAQQALQKAADKVNEIKTNAAALAVEMKNTDSADEVANLKSKWDDLSQSIVDSKSWFEVWQKDSVTLIERVAAAARVDAKDVQAFMDAFNDPNPVKRAKDMTDAFQSMKDKSAALGKQIQDLTDQQQTYGESATRGIAASDKWTDADERALNTAKQQKAALDGATGALQDQVATAQKSTEVLTAMAEAQSLTVDQYLAQQQAARDAAQAQQDLADKTKQAWADQQAAIEAEDEAYRSALTSMAGAQTLLGDAWDDPNSGLRRWADAQAKATKDANDTWEDFKDKNTPAQALDTVIEAMDKKIAANAEFEANLKSLAERGFGALAEQLRAGGPDANGAITQALAEATDTKVQKYATDQGTLLGKNLIQGSAASFSGDPTLQNAVNSYVGGVTPPNIVVTAKVKVDDSDWEAWKNKPKQFTAGVVVRNGQVQVI